MDRQTEETRLKLLPTTYADGDKHVSEVNKGLFTWDNCVYDLLMGCVGIDDVVTIIMWIKYNPLAARRKIAVANAPREWAFKYQ